MKTSDVIKYLTGGALIEILSKHENAPHVWLRETDEKEIIYTFREGEGRVGGNPVPIDAVLNGKINPLRIDKVEKMLLGFGLTADNIKVVLDTVGIAP